MFIIQIKEVLPYKIVVNDAKSSFSKTITSVVGKREPCPYCVTLQQFAAAYSTRSVCMQGGCDTKADFFFFFLLIQLSNVSQGTSF